jgi:hypothetical protein
MPAFLPANENAFWVFLALSVVLGGAAAFSTGRALAKNWQPFWRAFVLMALLAGGVRFLHYALFGEPLFSVQYYAVDFAIALGFAWLGFYMMRKSQMKRQYGWINAKE